MTRKPAEITGSLITVGDELLLGDIVNGNARYLAAALRSKGFQLTRMVTVGDVEDVIVRELEEALPASEFLIVTGGLGPTPDDRTEEAAARAFDRPLEPNPPYRDWLYRYITERGRSWSESLDRMTWLPSGAVKLGMPMAGFFLEHRGKPCFFLPGVPHEMETLVHEMVLPELEKRFPERRVYLKRILRVQEMPESEISRRLKDLEAKGSASEIGYLPQTAENWVTLLAAAESEAEALARISQTEEEVAALLGKENISGRDDEGIEVTVGNLLRENGWTLAVAESCTGGLLSHRITSAAGASDYFDRAFVTYSNRAKTELLQVSEELLVEHGAVSESAARSMAQGALGAAGADAALAITGIAGPSGGTPQKPVGTVFMACATAEATAVKRYLFGGARDLIQEKSAHMALVMLWRALCR